MRPFSTEFPVKSTMTRSDFISSVVTWLEGMQHSTVLHFGNIKDLDKESADFRSNTGEVLRVREFIANGDWQAIGFRYDYPDEEGRLWRTEGVLKQMGNKEKYNLVRFRSQCLAKVPEARLHTPKKPFLIKSLLKNGWGDKDKMLTISDQPFWLTNTPDSLKLAQSIVLGNATEWLPIVYISANNKNSWCLSQSDIKSLAYYLGGVAHIVVEPDRSFSFSLRDISNGRNVYDGAIGLSVPGQGIIKRYNIGWYIQDEKELLAKIKIAAGNIRSHLPSKGWDWTELQEQVLQALRTHEKKSSLHI
ncbi:hypothetical protein [Komagataeibacter europaeus]|nr:hypothetical protein [Komagataeibacter europaeus]